MLKENLQEAKGLIILLFPVVFFGGLAVMLGNRPMPEAATPPRHIPKGNYLSLIKYEIGKATSTEKRRYHGATKVKVTLRYSGPLGVRPIKFDIGDTRSSRPTTIAVLVDEKGQEYGDYQAYCTQEQVCAGQTARAYTYAYFLDISRLPAKTKIVLENQASADYSYAIPIRLPIR